MYLPSRDKTLFIGKQNKSNGLFLGNTSKTNGMDITAGYFLKIFPTNGMDITAVYFLGNTELQLGFFPEIFSADS